MEKTKVEDLKAAIYWIAVNYQQNFYEISSDWNRYNPDELTYLRNYIGYALYGPPEFEDIPKDSEDGLYIYEKEAMAVIESVYNKIVEHGTQLTDDKEVLCSILYTCIFDEKSLQNCDEYKLNELIFIRPIFKVQKGVRKKDEIELETWYVDTEARVYKNWSDFLKNNNMPTCTMIAPKDGIYQADLKEIWSETSTPVWVETHSNNASKKITNAIDIASTLVNFGCVGIGIAAMFNPVTAPFAITGAIGGAVSGVWGGSRAIQELVDRGTHDQSVSVINKDALPAWLGVAGSTLGLAASSGSALLSRAIRTGTSVGKGAQFAHDAIIISNLFVNSVGVGYNSMNMVQKYRDTGEVSAKDVFFLTAHVLFICNSAVRMRLASEIIKSDQNQILKDYEDSLRSNRHRKEFRRLVRNTGTNVADEVHRNEQIIRSLTKISNKDQFFATLVQNRKLFASTNTQLSFADGQVQVNGVSLVSPSTFASMPKESIVNLINQASETGQATSSMSRSTSTPGRSFMSANGLKAGVASLRDFCVQKSVSVDNFTPENTDVMKDVQFFPEKLTILKLVMSSGLSILKKISNGQYNTEDAINDVTNFVWDLVKINFATVLPGINMFESKYREYLMKIIKATHDYVKANSEEWANAFRNWWHSRTNESMHVDEDMQQSNNSEPKSQDSKKYNDMVMVDPMELMGLPKDVSIVLIEEAIISTGSKMNEENKPSNDMVKVCEAELSEFFVKHPISLNFKVADLANDIKGILNDLEIFERKHIIFYKVVVISMNIAQKVVENQALKKDIFVDVMKFLWILVNMNFYHTVPNTVMFDSDYEGFVINIIVAIYRYQLAESEKWLSAFHEYRSNYHEQ